MNKIAKCNQLRKKNTAENCFEKSKCIVVINCYRMHSVIENWLQYKHKC